MLYIGLVEIPGSEDHEGYVAGLRADGTHTDIWTDVRELAATDLVAYLPACECGWHGGHHPTDPGGFHAAAQEWLTGHFAELDAARPAPAALGRPLDTATDFLHAGDRARVRAPV